MPPPPEDTRGIVAPAEMFRHVRLERCDPPAALVGLVDWFWCVRWDLPMGFSHRQDVVAQPGVNVSVGTGPPAGTELVRGPFPLHSTVTGVSTQVSSRVLTGRGWNLAAKTTTGGFGAWCDDVAALTDAVVPPDGLLAVPVQQVADAAGVLEQGAAVLADALVRALDDRPPARIALARRVAEVAAAAEADRSVRSLEGMASAAGVTPRTLQRMFASCAGVSPTWVVRRFRLIDAAELVARGDAVDWAVVAAELGYADQAHLTRDFTATLGVPPAAYARAQRQS